MGNHSQQSIAKIRRDYNTWVANETLEDYALRYAPRSFRKWSEFRVANTAFGSVSFLVLEAIGGALTLSYGFTNACWAILAVGLIVFLTGFPIAYYAARHHVDMDLLTRGAGFGYIGSTLTSLIYAAFTFTLFALEASIMSLALEMYFRIPLAVAHLVSALVIIPLVTYGITNINRLQLWTQPVWLLLLIAPYWAVFHRDPQALAGLAAFGGHGAHPAEFDWLKFGAAATVAFSMVAQIGEQVDFLRFLPDKTPANRGRWWTATILAGPGWVVMGMARQLGGALLAYLAIQSGVPVEHAHEPTQMYLAAYLDLLGQPEWAMAATTLLVVISQIKINVTNAYAGSLAWSNFFSRLTHSHPGRVVWLVFNVMIALLLMELGLFGALERVLGLFSNVAIAWIGAVVADLVVNKPLGLSPPLVEFKRAYLPDINPVGVVSTLAASVISIAAFLGAFGTTAQAFSPFLALGIAFLLAPVIARITRGQHYLVPDRAARESAVTDAGCCICGNTFEAEDKAYCPTYQGNICSLCCSLDARCLDSCKPNARLDDQLRQFAKRWLGWIGVSAALKLRMLKYTLVYLLLAAVTGVFVGVIYYQDILALGNAPMAAVLYGSYVKVIACLLVFLGLGTWWLVLNNESRHVAQEESTRQTRLLLKEIAEHGKTDAKLKETMALADRANRAKSRFLSDMSHEFRTPLNSILGYAQLMKKDAAIPPHRREAVDIIERSGEHLSQLIEDILDIARIEARKFDLKREPVNLPALLDHLIRMFKPQAEAKGLAFRCQVSDRLPRRIRGDEKRIGQVLINLLQNAIKFTRTGEVVLRVGYGGEVAVFEVADSGEGIPEDAFDAIFQPFSRLRGGRGNAVSGSGLGLTISKILTEIMGGELSVKSVPGQGSTFRVKMFLPDLLAVESPEEEHIAGYSGRRRRILVVDDQGEQRTLLRSVLEPLGFVLSEAESGRRCLALTALEPPDLILLDLQLDDLHGTEVARKLRQSGYAAPIVVVSAKAYATDRKRALAAGCDDFIAKPLQIGELLAKIRLHLSLDWIGHGSAPAPARSEAVAPLLMPPAAELAQLAKYARIGDLRGLTDHLQRLAADDFAYLPFAMRVQGMAKAFRLADIKQLLGAG
ncbi:ATP-binding protein [Methylococcus sp. EFPC2]|uniref:ATP-binding protein n=1 Tax=Methylococcus sp. EFPC2 TaxID=2812648 RepID=UPI001F07E1E4|nr:ATP-binding protein [Methylococcus sp. EFPC2]